MHIKQHVREVQVRYLNAFPHPLTVLLHLFFVPGNGFYFIEGNPAISLRDPDRIVPFKEHYPEDTSFKDLVKKFEEEELLEYIAEKQFMYGTTREEALKDYEDSREKQVNVDEFDFEDFKDPDKVYKMILELEESPVFSFTRFEGEVENENTAKEVLELRIGIAEALIKFVEYVEKTGEVKFKYGCPETLTEVYSYQIPRLKEGIKLWRSLL